MKMFSSENIKLFLSYVIPSMFGMLIVGSYSIVDTVFIGQNGGEEALAAVAVTWPLVMLVGAVGDMLGTGAAIMVSQSRGGGKISSARRAVGNMLFWQVLFSVGIMLLMLALLRPMLILFGATDEMMAASYSYAKILIWGSPACMLMMGGFAVIRNDGHPVLSMWLTVSGLLLNILLDYIFIFSLEHGIIGAAWATVVSETITAVFSVVYYATPLTKLRYGKDMFTVGFKYLRRIIINGIPSLGSQLSIIAMLFFHNFQSLKYGHINGLAAYTYIGAVESLGSLLLTGLALGVQPLVAYLYGGRQYCRQNIIGNLGYITAFILGLLLMLVSFVGHDIFPVWFNLKGEAFEMASHGLIISSTAFLLLGVIRVAGYYYQATGKIFDSSLLIYGDAFFALPLCLFILPIYFGLNGVWMAMPVSRVLLFICVCWLWFFKKRPLKEEVCLNNSTTISTGSLLQKM